MSYPPPPRPAFVEKATVWIPETAEAAAYFDRLALCGSMRLVDIGFLSGGLQGTILLLFRQGIDSLRVHVS